MTHAFTFFSVHVAHSLLVRSLCFAPGRSRGAVRDAGTQSLLLQKAE